MLVPVKDKAVIVTVQRLQPQNTMADKPFTLKFRASRRLGYILLVMHTLALVAVWLTELPLIVSILLAVLLVLSAGYYWQTLFSSVERQLLFQPDTGWQINLQPVQIQQAFISRPLLIINYRQAAKNAALVLLSDSADADALRQLRILLRQKDTG